MAAAAAGHEFTVPTGAALHDLVVAHYLAILDHYGSSAGVKAARKHLGWYLETANAPGTLRGAILTQTNPEVVIAHLAAAFVDTGERLAA